MRKAFIEQLMSIATRDERIVLLTADLGFAFLDTFQRAFPDRFINTGVAEQNMIGIATGLAKEGYLPFVYSIATFATLRPLEFIRNGAVAHNWPLRIVGVGSGVDYSHDGLTHHALEDIGAMRLMPSLTIVCPADGAQAQTALEQTYALPGPIYYRISKNEQHTVPALAGSFDLGSIEIIHSGHDVLLCSHGTAVQQALDCAAVLETQGIHAAVAVFSTLSPLDSRALAYLLTGYPLAVSIEAHIIHGGLGTILAETISDAGLHTKLLRKGLRLTAQQLLGDQEYLYTSQGMDAMTIASDVEKAFARVVTHR